MSEEIRLPVSADTTRMERNISEAARRVGTINLNANIDARGLESLSRPLGRITGQADEFSKSMEAANARVLAFGASVGVINAISNAFKGLVSSTVEVEKSLTEISIIGDKTFSNLSKTSSGLFTTAKQLGVSYKDAAEATLEFARQGKSLTDSLNASKAALALTRTAGISATEAVMGLTSAVNAFGRGADAYIEYANKMSAVSDAFAVNNKDLIEGMSRSASVAQEAGVSFEELTALITTLQEKTGRGGAVIGNALKTIFTRVKNPEIIKDLQDLGVSIQDAATGSFLPATQILQNLANEFQSFDKNVRNNILLKVGGGFQVDKLAALLNDLKNTSGTFQRSFEIAGGGGGDILARVAKLNQTIDASFTNILTSAKQLGSNIGQIAFSKDFTNVLQTGASALSSLNDAIFGKSGDAEDQGSVFGKAVLKGIGSVISGPGLALFGGILAKLSLDFAKFSTTGVQTLLGITSKSKEEQLIQAAISKTLSENTRFQSQILRLDGNRVAQAELLLSVIKQQVNETKKLESISKGAAGILYERGVRLSGGAPEIKTSASGYVPNLVGAIAREKSEAPAGSRIIVDRNFPMGGGQRSTMVYNSNETRIKNFGGTGGDAIIPNYPINSAKGFTPNFAEPKRKVLDIDASRASVAGLTFAGEQKNPGILDKTKPVTIDDELLGKYSGSPLLGVLKQFEALKLVNLPVGNVYKFRKGLEGDEKQIKKDFIDKLNLKFRDQIISFLKEEITSLGMATGGGIDENLSKLKLNVIGPSTAGYIFEEILKIPTLTDAEKVAQYANQSDTDFFDIRNLKANFAEAYGLPKRNFDLAEIKFGQKELFDGISKKFLNEVIFQGGGADPKKFGVKDSNRAARGYIPNFANLGIAAYQPVMAGRVFEALVKKLNYVDLLENSIYPDFGEYEIKGSLKAALNDKNFGYGRSKGSKLIVPGDADKDLLDQLKKEKFAQVTFSNITNKDTQPIAREMIKKYGDPKYIGSLNNLPLIYPKNKFNIKAAANGYIPNFSELTGSGAGMLYQDPNFNELGGGQSGKFLAPKSGEGFGQKIFYKLGSDKINQEYQVNKSIKDFEKQNPALFKRNAISFTSVGKLLTKNGLAAGFERQVLTDASIDDFSSRPEFKIKDKGFPDSDITPRQNFAFGLSELLAQTGVKNIVQEYKKIYGPNSIGIDDIYAQNFKVNDPMQQYLIEETNKFFQQIKKQKIKGREVGSFIDNYIYRGGLTSQQAASMNQAAGAAGGLHTMFDTAGYFNPPTSAAKGYIPNFAKMTADLLTVSPNVARMSVDQFIEKYLGPEYSTGLSGTSANATKISGNPQQVAEAKRDFIMSMLGPNFLATYERDQKANMNRLSLIDEKSKTTGTRVKTEGGYLRAYGKYNQPDLSAVLEGTFSGEAKRLTYEELDTKAEKIFEQSNLTQYWNEIVKTMQLVGEAYRDEMSMASQTGTRANFDYNTVEVPSGVINKFGLKERYRAKNKIKELTGLIRPKLIEGLLEGEKGIQGLVLNQPEYDKAAVEGDYFVLLDEKAAQLKKLVSNYLINPDLDPLQVGSSQQIENRFRIKTILDTLDGTFGSPVGRKGILLDTLKSYRKYSEGNPQLQKFFMDGEDRPGAFVVKKTLNQNTRETSNRLGAFLKPNFPQEIIERIATVLAASYNRDSIFQLSNLDVGYTGALSYEGYKSNPLLDTFATSPNAPAQVSAASIASTIKYGDYKNNKAYYDSLGKWKYDPASKSMIRQAAKGYIPNFSKAAINEAVMREQMQSGLPSSQISITQDSRLANNLNPSGFAVINKRDEPNGKVPTNRIADAYRNASKGFIPNFSEQFRVVVDTAAGGGVSTQEATTRAAELAAAQKKLSEKLLDYVKTLGLSQDAEKKVTDVLAKYKKRLDDSGITEKQARTLSSRIESNVPSITPDEYAKLKLLLISPRPQNTSSTQPNAGNQSNTGNQPPQGGGRTSGGGQQPAPDQPVQKSTKSFSELATNLFVFQSALSFASGAMSGFGTTAEKIGESLNDFGQAVIAVTQVGSLAEQIKGGKRNKKAGFFEEGGAFRSGLASAITVAGGVYAAVQAIGAIDKAILTMNGTFTKSKNFIDDLEVSFSKYNIQLSEQTKRVSENISRKGNVSGAGFSGFFNSIGLNYASIFGDKDVAAIQAALGNTGLSDTANQYITKRASDLIAPQISDKYAKENEGKQISSKELQKQTTQQIANLFKQAESKSLVLQATNPMASTTLRNFDDNIKKAQDSGDKESEKNLKKQRNLFLSNRNEFKQVVDSEKLEKNIVELLDKKVTKTQDATIAEQARKDALLFSSDLLKQQLTSYQQIAKIQSSIPTMSEVQLSVEKELLTTTEARRMEIDRQIKSLSEQRQLTSEIKDTGLTFGREKIDKFLGMISGSLDVREGVADRIRGAYSSLAMARSPEEAQGLFKGLLDAVALRQNEKGQVTQEATKENENLLKILNLQLDVVKANSAARSVQNAIEAQNLAYVKQQNYEYNIRKEAINTQLTLEQKSLDIAKERRNLREQTSDVKFQASLIGKNPALTGLLQARRELENIDRLEKDLADKQSGYQIAKKQSVAQFLFSKNIRPERVEEILKKPEKDQIADITLELQKESNSFAMQVESAGKDFYTKIYEASILISDKLNPSGTTNLAEELKGRNLENLSPEFLTATKRQLQSQIGPFEEETARKNSEIVTKIDETLNKISEKQYPQTQFDGTSAVADMYKALGPNAPQTDLEKDKINELRKQRKAEIEREMSKFTFEGGLNDAKQQIEGELMTFPNTFGKNLALGFRDSMRDVFKELSSGDSTTPLKDRLLGVANSFLEKINQGLMERAANSLTNSILGSIGGSSGRGGAGGGGFNGGFNGGFYGGGGGTSFLGFASGGKISGGSGNKDDVPAMLMGGEYVLKKSAVNKYGTSFLDSLNEGKISKYASGGMVFDEFSLDQSNYEKYKSASRFTDFQSQGLSFNKEGAVTNIQDYSGSESDKPNELMKRQTAYYKATQQTGKDGFFAPGKFGTGAIVGQKNLLAFATQQATSSKYDKISSSKDMASIDLAGDSENLTTAALNDDLNIRNTEVQEAKQKAMDLYIQGQISNNERVKMDYENQKEYERQMEEYKKAKKEARKKMWINLGIAVVGALATGGAFGTGIAKFMKGGIGAGLKGSLGGMMGGSKTDNDGTSYASTSGLPLRSIGSNLISDGDTEGPPSYSWMKKPSFFSKTLADFSGRKYAEGGIVKEITKQEETRNEYLNNIKNYLVSKNSSGGYLDNTKNINQTNLSSQNFRETLNNKFSEMAMTNLALSKSNSINNNLNNEFQANGAIKNTSLNFSRFASGGMVQGNGYGDNVPSLLTGGEFVVNKESAQKIGYSNLNNLNSGNSNSISQEIDMSGVEQKLDELISRITENREAPNIVITVNSNGSEKEEGKSNNSDRDLAKRIKQSVLQILADEKRLGGLLR
jgi:TP901 family phage tail tape measure protein